MGHSLWLAICHLLVTLELNLLCSPELSTVSSCQSGGCCSQKEKGTCLLVLVNKTNVVHGAEPQHARVCDAVVGNQKPQIPASTPL